MDAATIHPDETPATEARGAGPAATLWVLRGVVSVQALLVVAHPCWPAGT